MNSTTRFLRRFCGRGVAAALSALAVLAAGAACSATASADSPIEGVWSFNGGRIAVHEQQPGVFEGIVVTPTTFSLCAHPEGERIWTGIVGQADGSYWGSHQWFFESSECVRNPALGPTAWRVLEDDGGRFLRACFSEPGSNLQPIISSSGTAADATFGCVDSALISALPELSPATASRYVQLPSNRACLARRRLRVRFVDPENDPIKRAEVIARSAGVRVRARTRQTEKGILATLRLRRLRGPTITVRAQLTTLLGQHLARKRTYRRCPGGAGK